MTKWQALDNISLPRPGDVGKQTDLVMKGETFEASEAQVAGLLRPKTGPPRVRKASEASTAMPLILPRAFSGPLRGPTGDARPDPAGSSHVSVALPPEATEPALGSEMEPDALDLPPGTRIHAGV